MKFPKIAIAAGLLLTLSLAACSGDVTENPSDAQTEATVQTPEYPMEYTSVESVKAGDPLLYCNDLELNSVPDPCLLPVTEEDGRVCYYLYATGNAGYYSYNLTEWTKINNLFARPADTWQWGFNLAPEVIYDEDLKLYLLFSWEKSKNTEFHYISVAVSASPKGPFVQWTGVNADGLNVTADVPVYDFSRMDKSHPLYEGVIRAIDVYPFVDPVSGDKYLYWTRGWNDGGTVKHSTSEIWGMKMKDWMTPDYSTVTRLTEVGKITPGGDKFPHSEASINEGPAVIYKDGTYYLTYSLQGLSSKGYSVWQATSDSPLGTFTKLTKDQGGMVLGVDSHWNHASGTGHHNFVTIGDELYIVYHSHKYREHTSSEDRAFTLDRLVWVKNAEGKAILQANGPTWSPLPLPSAISGYENAAPAATVSASTAADQTAYLTDGILNMHEYALQPEAEFTATTMVTLSWDSYRTVGALLMYNTTFEDKCFDKIDRIEFVCRAADGSEEIRYIDNAVYNRDLYYGDLYTQSLPDPSMAQYLPPSLFNPYNRPGAALVIRPTEEAEVKEIRITFSVPEGQQSVRFSEIEVLVKIQN